MYYRFEEVTEAYVEYGADRDDRACVAKRSRKAGQISIFSAIFISKSNAQRYSGQQSESYHGR